MMRILIPITDEYDDEFILWLLEKIQSEMLQSLNIKKLEPFVKYQANHNVFKPTSSDNQIDFVKCVIAGIKLLTYRKVKDRWIIYMREDVLYPNYFAKVYSICKFINYGLSDIKGYPIFTDTLNRVSAQITKYYNRFVAELMI